LPQGQYQYLLGDDFLIAPIHEDKGERTVAIPPGRWHYLFGDDQVYEGPCLITRKYPLDEYPVFIRAGAIVPLKVTRSYSGFGDRDSAEYRTWLIYPRGNSAFTLRHPETHPSPDKTVVTVNSEKELSIEISGKSEPHILRIHAASKPNAVRLNGESLAEEKFWRFRPEERKLVIRVSSAALVRYDITWP
jgi:alpha-glucosidase (family GH31 glycosyl hydrolase)